MQIAQIAHHNAQILRQIKGLHPPVTQYHNPFPVYPPHNGPKHLLVPANNFHQHQHSYPPKSSEKYPTTQNLISSSSNVAQTVLPHIPYKGYVGNNKPTYLNGKPEQSQLKYFNNIQSTSKIPQKYSNSATNSQNYQIFSTTSRIPLLR